MFRNVLIADDLGSINKGVLSALHSLGIETADQVQYCDDAYLRIKKSYLDNNPIDLLISDWSFKADHRVQKFNSGDELAEQLRKEFPKLKIIMFSIEDRINKIRNLFSSNLVDAYVCKGRNGLHDLTAAIDAVNNNNIFVSTQVSNALGKKTNMEIDDQDIVLLRELSRGHTHEEISAIFKSHNFKASSLSAIEKRTLRLRDKLKANNAIHLVANAKDLGLI
jgi:DNA-binding NarL/FixJ family response regulator